MKLTKKEIETIIKSHLNEAEVERAGVGAGAGGSAGETSASSGTSSAAGDAAGAAGLDYTPSGTAKEVTAKRVNEKMKNAWEWLSPILPDGSKMTSGARIQADQDRIICNYSKKRGIPCSRANLGQKSGPDADSRGAALKILKKKGLAIGRWTGITPGHGTGEAFDISGASLAQIKKAVIAASEDADIPVEFGGFGTRHGSILEPKNNAVHVRIISAAPPDPAKIAQIISKYTGQATVSESVSSNSIHTTREEIEKIIDNHLTEAEKERSGVGAGAGAGTSRQHSAVGRKSKAAAASSCTWNKGAPGKIDSDWKQKTLIDVISGGGKSKKFDDVIPLDGGSIGIAHWAAGGLKRFLKDNPDAPQPPGGARDCRETDGGKIGSGKNASPSKPGCYLEPGTKKPNSWVSKMKKWLGANKDTQIKHWNKTKADAPAAVAKRHGWNTSRHMSIAAGISNSLGKGGFKSLAAKNGWDPEKTLDAYAAKSAHKQRRKDRIDNVFPCNEVSIAKFIYDDEY